MTDAEGEAPVADDVAKQLGCLPVLFLVITIPAILILLTIKL